MKPKDVAESAYRMRALADPRRHLLVPVTRATENREGRSCDDAYQFEPTAFIYSYMAWNSLYSYDWSSVNSSTFLRTSFELPEHPTNRNERQRLFAHVRFTLAEPEEVEAFSHRARRVCLPTGEAAETAFAELHPFPEDDGLRGRVIAAARRLALPRADADGTVVSSAQDLFAGVYEVRCNLFHGSKAIADLALDDPQFSRIALFRMYSTTLLDTFFGKLRRLAPNWDVFFEGSMSTVVDHPKSPPESTERHPGEANEKANEKSGH